MEESSNHPVQRSSDVRAIVERSHFNGALCSHQDGHSGVHQFATRASEVD